MSRASSISRTWRSPQRWLYLLCLLTSLTLTATDAFADAQTAEVAAAPQIGRATPARAYDEWQAANPWAYGTDSFFSLTRGLQHEQLPTAGRVLLYLVTVPIDLAQLPAAALGGFWGD